MHAPSRGLPATVLKPLEIGFSDLGEPAGGEHRAVDILHHARQVADLAVGVDDAGLLAAGRAIADEFHDILPGTFVFLDSAERRVGADHALAEAQGQPVLHRATLCPAPGCISRAARADRRDAVFPACGSFAAAFSLASAPICSCVPHAGNGVSGSSSCQICFTSAPGLQGRLAMTRLWPQASRRARGAQRRSHMSRCTASAGRTNEPLRPQFCPPRPDIEQYDAVEQQGRRGRPTSNSA